MWFPKELPLTALALKNDWGLEKISWKMSPVFSNGPFKGRWYYKS